MKTINSKFQQMVANVPKEVLTEVDLSFDIASEIDALMQERGLSKKQFADALGKKPSEVTKWLSGQHNFTIRTIAMLSSFFGKPIIRIATNRYVFLEEKPRIVSDDSSFFIGNKKEAVADRLLKALEENRQAMIARNEPELTLEEINAEIAAARAEMKARKEKE